MIATETPVPDATSGAEPPPGRRTPLWIAGALLFLAGLTTFYSAKYSLLINERLRAGPYAHTASIYTAPVMLVPGTRSTVLELATRLRRAGYGESTENPTGWYRLQPGQIEIHPGPAAYFSNQPAVVRFAQGRVSSITAPEGEAPDAYWLEPQLLANISDERREKRRLIPFAEIPKPLVAAIISAEDKRFFRHSGVDLARIAKAAWVDLREGRKEQGASTLTMQLARSLWLDREKSWRRKVAEIMIALQLERKLSKEQIFEYYFNQVYLGRQGSFSVHGFGEAARTYFDKDIQNLDVAEAATLAGMVQAPSYWNPFRHPRRVEERRNLVLSLMRQNGFIDAQVWSQATASPLNLKRGGGRADAPYFLDLINSELQEKFEDRETGPRQMSVYTTLDPDLQNDAEEAIRAGMAVVDAALRARKYRGSPPQVALVALDPYSGHVKALCGGRNYRASQLNRALAKRQPGSVFKPFVFAAALNTAVVGAERVFTPASTVADEPTTFWFDGRPYSPANFRQSFHGTVSLRRALSASMNAATVRLAEMVGYDKVANLARQVGLGDVQPTPALALGAYEATPLEVAGAYTTFANQGVYVRPEMIASVRAANSAPLYTAQPARHPVLDPRVAYLLTDMLQDVIRHGTGTGVGARGFRLPAAGKTGTSRDGWFAGFTTRLLCVVWVGFDDNRDLGLEGSRSALPVWVEFMKRAHRHGPYREAIAFQEPGGLARLTVDPTTGLQATAFCPATRTDVFIQGTQPRICDRHLAPPVYEVADTDALPADATGFTDLGPLPPAEQP